MPDESLRRDRERVEREGREAPHAVDDLVGGERHRAQARRDPHREEDREPQRQGPHDEGETFARRRPDPAALRTQAHPFAPCEADDDDAEHDRHRELRDRRARAGTCDTEAEPPHERDAEDRVERRAADCDVERRARVEHAAQHTRRREGDEHARQTGNRPAQVVGGVAGDVRVRAEEPDDVRRREAEPDREGDAEREREPQTVDACLERLGAMPRARTSGDGGGRCVREEDAQADDGHEDRAREGEPCELGGAEVADDGGVDEDEEGLGDERSQGGDGEREDRPVQRVITCSFSWWTHGGQLSVHRREQRDLADLEGV